MVLGGFDDNCSHYVEKYVVNTEKAPVAAASSVMTLRDSVVKGLKDQAYKLTVEMLKETAPMDVINNELVPALDVVGQGFEKGTIFLPQLLMSAEAAKAGFEAVNEHMKASGGVKEKKATIVIATVKGDIHDIGKNIVKVLLENYGYDVIDLGKDVTVEEIVDAVVKNQAPVAALSALMTTTVVNMEETIKELRKGNKVTDQKVPSQFS